jgi:hypothetical protein
MRKTIALGGLAVFAFAFALALGAACTTKEGDTITGPDAPPPVYVVLTADAIPGQADCTHLEFGYHVEAHVRNATSAGGTLQLDFGDGASYVGEGLDLTRDHTYVGCGADGYVLRAVFTSWDGQQWPASTTLNPCVEAACGT